MLEFFGSTAAARKNVCMTERPSTELQRALNSCLDAVRGRVSAAWKGREQEGLISLVRVLDQVAVAPLWGLDACGDRSSWKAKMSSAFVLHGASAGLRPFLSVVKDIPGGVPWGRSRLDAQRYS